ncbi:THAP domain-containing protein 1-like [Babylonia areolata]|uniref:THAP domain-containing protein 1-like n=1 Tax=Babylonia areolata TaxID=304850 RepID=UPI003FD39EF7
MSGTFCAAWGCFNRQKKGKSFHRFPKDEERRRQWVAALKREGFQATDYSRICGDHFEKQCYNPSGLLKHTAVPTLFNFPAHLQKEVKPRKNPAPRNLTTESSMPISIFIFIYIVPT